MGSEGFLRDASDQDQDREFLPLNEIVHDTAKAMDALSKIHGGYVPSEVLRIDEETTRQVLRAKSVGPIGAGDSVVDAQSVI